MREFNLKLDFTVRSCVQWTWPLIFLELLKVIHRSLTNCNTHISHKAWVGGREETAKQIILNDQLEYGSAHLDVAATSLSPTASYFFSSHIPRRIVPERALVFLDGAQEPGPSWAPPLHFFMKPFLFPTALHAPEVGRALSAYHTQRFCPSVRHEHFSNLASHENQFKTSCWHTDAVMRMNFHLQSTNAFVNETAQFTL